jgi:hypothetical protein
MAQSCLWFEKAKESITSSWIHNDVSDNDVVGRRRDNGAPIWRAIRVLL